MLEIRLIHALREWERIHNESNGHGHTCKYLYHCSNSLLFLIICCFCWWCCRPEHFIVISFGKGGGLIPNVNCSLCGTNCHVHTENMVVYALKSLQYMLDSRFKLKIPNERPSKNFLNLFGTFVPNRHIQDETVKRFFFSFYFFYFGVSVVRFECDLLFSLTMRDASIYRRKR